MSKEEEVDRAKAELYEIWKLLRKYGFGGEPTDEARHVCTDMTLAKQFDGQHGLYVCDDCGQEWMAFFRPTFDDRNSR